MIIKPEYLVLAGPANRPNDALFPTLAGIEKEKTTAIQLCTYIALQKLCPYENSCKYSHDVKLYLEKKEPDLGTICPNYNLYNECPYGVKCRFYKAHPINDTISASFVNVDVHNSVPKPLLERLRKNQYHFKYLENAVLDRCDSLFDASDIINKNIDFKDKLYLAPLTTVGNLPFRRICKDFGADITCGEMALASNILKGHASEWALMKKHATEDCFGVQICGSHADIIGKCVELINREISVDFIDINMGCPIDLVFEKGMGSALLERPSRVKSILETAVKNSNVPITAKFRTGVTDGKNCFHKLLPILTESNIKAITLHGRTRQQRYTKEADWDYISSCRPNVPSHISFIGNGDVLSFTDYLEKKNSSGVDTILLGRGPLIKPWLFTEIKEQRHWDISSNERLNILKKYCDYGLQHFGSDSEGVDKTRHYLLEWLSFLYRYVPVGVLETITQVINDRPPSFVGRNELETLMASDKPNDWIRITSMLLGSCPSNFKFSPKHMSNSYKG